MAEIDKNYIDKAKEFFNTENVDAQETYFGYAIIKGNWKPSVNIDTIKINELDLCIKECVLHERILVIEKNIPIRSHQEEWQEIVQNIWDTDIYYISSIDGSINSVKMPPEETMYSMVNNTGFFHGFNIEKTGLLYVAKALDLSYVEGNSFRIPENSYKPE